ncbi:MAG: hypothetical protein AAF658_19070, partial [Myxococcota bacterium]
ATAFRRVPHHAHVPRKYTREQERRIHMAAHFDVFDDAESGPDHRLRCAVEEVLVEKNPDQRAFENELPGFERSQGLNRSATGREDKDR